MSPLMTEMLVWASFALVCAAVGSPWVYVTISEWRWDTKPRDLKNFAAMKKAFRMGSKTRLVDGRRSSAIFAMREFAGEGADPGQREAIALMMCDAISEVLDQSDNRAANDVDRMLGTLAAAAPPWEADFLAKVSRSKLDGWVRGNAVERLARIRGRASLEFLLVLADDPPISHAVAAAIAGLGRPAATPETLARLERMLGETQNVRAPSAAARALISLGQAANPILAEHLERFDPWTAFAVRVKAAGIGAATLIERLFAAGIVGEDRRKLIKPSIITKMQKALNGGDGFKAVVTFLQRMRAIHVFDTEWDPAPEYDVLLRDLSAIGAPRVMIANIDVRMAGEAGQEINCTVLGQSARFTPKFMDDWTDLQSVLTGLNAALEAAGRYERFAALLSGDQNACVIVAHDGGLASLVETLGLPLDGHANTPIAIGMAAENHAGA